MTGVALASAAAVVAATPVITPSITGSPLSISSARYDLATFADVFTVPPTEWVNAYFEGWGGAVGPNNQNPADPTQQGGLEPWASQCNGNCYVPGLSGLLYLGLDALIDGNGKGFGDVGNWNVGALNYYFEGGFSAGAEYLAQSAFGQSNPIVATLITIAFAGPALVGIIVTDTLNLIAGAVAAIPVIGPVISGAIYAYVDGQIPGVLQYVADLIAGLIPTGAAATKPAAVNPAAALSVAAASSAVRSLNRAATGSLSAAAPSVAAAVEPAASSASSASKVEAASAPVGTPAVGASESAPAPDAAPTAAEVKAGATADTKSETAPAQAPSKAASKRPVRDAVTKATKSITSALDGAALDGAKAGPKAGATSAPAAGTAEAN